MDKLAKTIVFEDLKKWLKSQDSNEDQLGYEKKNKLLIK